MAKGASMETKRLGWRQGRPILALLVLVGIVGFSGWPGAQAAPAKQSAEQGKDLFAQWCASCHTIGGGKLVGPDLLGVNELRPAEWLERWISEPDKMLAENDPLARELLQAYNGVPMPNLGVSREESRAILAYIATASSSPAPAPAAPEPVMASGDPAIGRKLFTGQIGLANGGSACISCHNVSQVGVLGGGTLGPDLSHVANRYGESGLKAALAGLPFPTMKGIFDTRPLTPDEVLHLSAYLIEADRLTPAAEPERYTFVWVGVAGALAMLGVAHLVWLNRHRGVRRPLVRRMRLG